jgi:hypothetical protein
MTECIQFETAKMSDINGILALQDLYLVANLLEEEKASGFVTTPFTTQQLTEVIQKSELFIAKDNHKIIAYIFAGSWDFFNNGRYLSI